MKKATVRDLRYHFSKLEDLLRDGEEIQISRRNRVIARLLPPESPKPSEWPDFPARPKKIFGNKKLKVTGTEIIAADRDRY
jgi:antitoxin (DNA-binding transcriptional repressor) of toxin-antitoxin stability system